MSTICTFNSIFHFCKKKTLLLVLRHSRHLLIGGFAASNEKKNVTHEVFLVESNENLPHQVD